MRIAYISTGAAGMYCGTCIHDNTLAAALVRKGHEVALVPTYTPMRTDETSVSIDQIFYGGINVYLQEKFGFFRHTPWILDRLFNSPRLLSWLSKMSSTTDARDLGALTVSVLNGERGHQKKELEKLVAWLKNSYKPDLVHLNISMFLGMAREIKNELDVPVLCGVQGEDLFLEELIEPYRTQARDIMRERANDADGFIATSRYYADYMADFLCVPREKFHVVMLGIKLDDYIGAPNSLPAQAGQPANPFVIGYLARLAPEKGLHLLVEAFKTLRAKNGAGKLKLKVAGYLSKKDETYFQEIRRQLAADGHDGDFEYFGEVDRSQKVNFLSSLHVLSVPTVYKESKGLFVLEALANGVPVVQPAHGSFPEVIEATGGGILVEPESSAALAEGLEQLMNDHTRREQMGRRGKEAVRRHFSDQVMADAMVEVYKQYV
jgi:glycosyltransferase involved in cell wall biosynthesis